MAACGSEHHKGMEMGYKGMRCPIGESEGDPASAPRGRFPQGMERGGVRDSSRQVAVGSEVSVTRLE